MLAARKMSGKIATSEASQLWAESKAIREWSRERIQTCDEECERLRVELNAALSRIRDVEDELEEARRQLANLTKEQHGF